MAKSQQVLQLCNWHFFAISYTFGPILLFESVGLKMILIYFWLTIKRNQINIT